MLKGPSRWASAELGGVMFVDPVSRTGPRRDEKQLHGVRVDYQPVGFRGKACKVCSTAWTPSGCTVVPLSDEQLRGATRGVATMRSHPALPGRDPVADNLPDVADRSSSPAWRWSASTWGRSPAGTTRPWSSATRAWRCRTCRSSWSIRADRHDVPLADDPARASADWNSKYGREVRDDLAGRHAAKGNNGMATAISQTARAIGYLEQSFPLENNLPAGRDEEQDGEVRRRPGPGQTAAAAARADDDSRPTCGSR